MIFFHLPDINSFCKRRMFVSLKEEVFSPYRNILKRLASVSRAIIHGINVRFTPFECARMVNGSISAGLDAFVINTVQTEQNVHAG